MYISSSIIEKKQGKNYLKIFLNPKYPYTLEVNDKNRDLFDILFEEPSMDDMSNLKKLGISLEKFISYENAKSIKTMNSYSKDAIESIFKYQEQQQKIKEEEELADPSEEKKEESQIDSCRSYLTSVFTRSSDFEDEDSNTDFYKELGKFTSYIESKARRDIDSCLINLNLDLLKKYNAEYLFIIEEIIIEYFSFFFAHLPSKMFHLSTRL